MRRTWCVSSGWCVWGGNVNGEVAEVEAPEMARASGPAEDVTSLSLPVATSFC